MAVLSEENVVCHAYELKTCYLDARLFQRLAADRLQRIFSELEVPARWTPGTGAV